jgi:hypothetical protein
MATQTTRKSGENHVVTFGATTMGTARHTVVSLNVRTTDARASGDAGPVDKELGLASGQVETDYLITDETTLALLGSLDTLTLKDSAGTVVFEGTCLCRAMTRRENYQEMTVVDAVFAVQGVPTVPILTALV